MSCISHVVYGTVVFIFAKMIFSEIDSTYIMVCACFPDKYDLMHIAGARHPSLQLTEEGEEKP